MEGTYENKIRQHVEKIFAAAPNTQQVNDVKEEMILNTIDRFHDAINCGQNEERAYVTAISGIGDVSELINSFSPSPAAPYQGDWQRQNTQQGPQYSPPQAPSPAQPQKSNGGKIAAVIIGIICGTLLLLVLIGSLTGVLIVRNLSGGLLSGIFNSAHVNVPTSSFVIGDGDDTGFDSTVHASGEYSVPSADINTIIVDWVTGGVVIKPYSGNDITFSETSRSTVMFDDNDALRYKLSGNELHIRFCKNRENLIRDLANLEDVFAPKQLTLNIPQSMLGGNGLVSIQLNCVANNTEVSGIALNLIDIDNVSGDVTLNNVEAEKHIYINNVSGDAELTDCACGALLADGVSGEIKAVVNAESVKIASVSGNINVAVTGETEYIEAETISGEVSLTIPPQLGFELEYDTVSGDIRLPNGKSDGNTHYTHLNGGMEISIDTVSGDAYVTVAE